MKKLFFLSIAFTALTCLPFSFANAQGGVSINSAGAAPDNSAGLDVSFTNKGELMPRMTTVQRDAIANPAKGLTIFNTDCSVYNYNAGSPSSPIWATINATNALIAALTISANPVGAICANTGVTFTASPSNGINSPSYQWQVNGSNVGTNSATFTDSTLNNGDVVTCILSTSEACVTGSPATSNAINMTVNPIPSTPGSITGNTSACAGTTGNIYSISPVAGAASYNWTVPGGASIASGSGNTSITVTFGTGSGNISVVAVNGCGTSEASSQAIAVTSIPSTPGSITGASSVCTSATAVNYSISGIGEATSYNWTVPSGATITVNTDTVISVNFASNPAGNISVSVANFCGTSGQSTISVSQSYICSPLTFSYSGGAQTFTVPSGVTTINVQCWGAQGQNSYGGLGGYATGNLAVTPGEQLVVYVGGQGGFNGGGTGNVGNGGGGTDVRQGGATLNNRVIVAGGGGAAYGNNGPSYGGGDGGGTSGNPAVWANNGQLPQGGAQNGGGYWGGSFGVGANSDSNYSGGAGGGGWYGGGSNNTGNGAPVMNSSGGGGSGYVGGVTASSMQTGVQSGNGQVIFTW